MATLHRLLWGAAGVEDFHEWPIRPWEMPAIGLPVRVAASMFALVAQSPVPTGWKPAKGPLVWRLGDQGGVLSAGRRRQFGCVKPKGADGEDAGDNQSGEPDVSRTTEWDVPPHATYFVPLLSGHGQGGVNRGSYTLYCDILLLLTAMDGGESILNSIMKSGSGVMPFEDRWAWRSRLHLPRQAWSCIEKVIRWAERPRRCCIDLRYRLLEVLEPCSATQVTENDFGMERVDIQLSADDREIVRSIRPFGGNGAPLPDELALLKTGLADDLCVRLGQLTQWPAKQDVLSKFPTWKPADAHRVMEQVATVFYSPSDTSSEQVPNHGTQRSPDVIVLPELSIPQAEVGTLHELVAKTGCAALAGLYWRVLQPAYPSNERGVTTRRWIVNEAVLSIPIGHGELGPTLVRSYRVRKPVTAHVEKGLVQALSKHVPNQEWEVLGGRTWYRFVHPQWGDFAIAICADLLDGDPWRTLRGEILHLFMVAFNQDVNLYESLTWTRAYENYANLVAVNHGSRGGSFLWSPRRKHGHELARIRGRPLFLSADVRLPVRELLEQQQTGIAKAIERAMCYWGGHDPESGRYKSPPPGYRRTAVRSEE